MSEGSSLGSPPTYETRGLLRTGSEHGSSEDSQSESGPEAAHLRKNGPPVGLRLAGNLCEVRGSREDRPLLVLHDGAELEGGRSAALGAE